MRKNYKSTLIASLISLNSVSAMAFSGFDLSADIPAYFKNFSSFPSEFASRDLSRAAVIRFDFQKFPEHWGNGVGFRISGFLGANYTPVSIIGGEAALVLLVNDFSIEPGLCTAIQGFLAKDSDRVTVLDSSWYSVYIRGHYRRPRIDTQLEVGVIGIRTSAIAKQEGIDTEAKHKDSYYVSLGSEFKLTEKYFVSAFFDFYKLGALALLSKTFAFAIPSDKVEQGRVGFGFKTEIREYWLRFSYVFGVVDELEHIYRAPFLYQHNLMSKAVLSGEFKWHF